MVMGMDWHSSGITTSVLGALKRGLDPVSHELGVFVCGGRGKHSLKTPGELLALGERYGMDGEDLARTSRLTAKVDSAAVQDGFQLYLHSFIIIREGGWTVVQQGMNTRRRQARRYHWLSEKVASFVDDPHSAIQGQPGQGPIINLATARARRSRELQLGMVRRDPDEVTHHLQHLRMPAHHEVRPSDLVVRRLSGVLRAAADEGPERYSDLLLTRGLGARTLEALALVAEVIHGAPCRFSDPARFAFAHGGKDGHPFPVPLKVYDRTLSVLRHAVDRAKLGNEERLAALKRLGQQSRMLERAEEGDRGAFDALMARERAASHRLGGMTAKGPARAPVASTKKKAQLRLPGM